jgi:hypothetical protein
VTSFVAPAHDPGARVLWSLRRRTADVRCVLMSGTNPIEVRVLQDRDLVIKEMFMDERAALNWAEEYSARLRQHGWRDSPENCAPFFVA